MARGVLGVFEEASARKVYVDGFALLVKDENNLESVNSST